MPIYVYVYINLYMCYHVYIFAYNIYIHISYYHMLHLYTFTCTVLHLYLHIIFLYLQYYYWFTRSYIYVHKNDINQHAKNTGNECCDGVYLLNLDWEFIQIWTTLQYPRPLSLSTHCAFQIAWVNPVLYCMFHLIFALNFHDLGTGLPATTQATQRVVPPQQVSL